MSSLNQNYVSAIRGFTSPKAPQIFRAASAGGFNQVSAGGRLAAYVLFWLDAEIQQIDNVFGTRAFLWGNLDDANTTGWGIYLEPDLVTGQMQLVAGLYAAGGLRSSSTVLSNLESPSFVERLILAGLWYDGQTLVLSINGSFMAADIGVAPDAYAPSALAPTLGGDVLGNAVATYANIVSAGYAPDGDAISQAGGHFKACREAFGGGYLIPQIGVDWSHRYEASAAVKSGTSGTVTKGVAGVVQASAPVAPTVLVDQGNAGPTPFAGVNAVSLTRLGANDLFLSQVAQVDWYAAPAFEFAAPPPPP